MVEPFEARSINIVLRAERAFVERPLGALIDDGALVARKRRAVLLALEKILADFGTDFLEDETDVRGERIVAQHRMPLLQHVMNPSDGERDENDQWNFDQERVVADNEFEQQSDRDQDDAGENNKARL